MVHRLLMVFQTGPPRTLLAMGSPNADTMTGGQLSQIWKVILVKNCVAKLFGY